MSRSPEYDSEEPVEIVAFPGDMPGGGDTASAVRHTDGAGRHRVGYGGRLHRLVKIFLSQSVSSAHTYAVTLRFSQTVGSPNRSVLRQGLFRTILQLEAFEEISQNLILAQPVIFMARLAKEGTYLMLTD